MAPLPRGYKIVDSGDPEAPWELVGPGGRTVTISDTKKGLRNIAVVDIGEQSDLLRRQAQAMQEASGHVKPRHGHPMGTRVMLKGGEHRGVVVGHDHQGGVEMNKVRWDDGTVTTRSVGGLVPETPKPPSAGLKPNSKVRTKVGAVTKAAGVDSIQPGEVGTVGSIGGGMAQVHFTPQPGKRGSRVAHIPVADLEAADQGTTQKLKSPSSTATPSQDQRKAAERAADASGGTIRPTAASSGKQAADPSIAKHSKTTSKSPKAGRAVEGTDAQGKPLVGHVTRKSSSGGTVYVKDTGGKIRVVDPERIKRTNVIPDAPKKPRQLSNDPKQIARRAKRGFPSGH